MRVAVPVTRAPASRSWSVRPRSSDRTSPDLTASLGRSVHNGPVVGASPTARPRSRRPTISSVTKVAFSVEASTSDKGCLMPSMSIPRATTQVLRFGDPRVQALAGALSVGLLAVTAITNKSLRALMTGLLGEHYPMKRASYDLTGCAATDCSPAIRAATATNSPTTAWPSPSSTPRSTTGSCDRCWPPNDLRRRHHCGPRSTPSTSTSTPASPRHDYRKRLPDTLHKCQRTSDQGSLADR
jgi:hypothetical protein